MTADFFAQGLWGQNGYSNCHYLISHLVCNHFAQIINAYCLHASFTDSIYELSLKCSLAWSALNMLNMTCFIRRLSVPISDDLNDKMTSTG